MNSLIALYYRLLSSGPIAAKYLFGDPLAGIRPPTRHGRLRLEIVSHCWGYAHLQAYQLSSLVLHPPHDIDVTMTVFYAHEDDLTCATLAYFAQQTPANVQWNWQKLPKPQLFRRAIGRNQAALNTLADWIWFTDCDLTFGSGCLDGLNQALQGRSDRLLYPDNEYLSDLLPDDHPALNKDETPQIKSLEGIPFHPHQPSRATGPLQIVHGDVARAAGYCRQTGYFMQAVERWAKTHEDRTFRWLINTQGKAIHVPEVYRLRHQSKGRYKAGLDSRVRSEIRRMTDHRWQ